MDRRREFLDATRPLPADEATPNADPAFEQAYRLVTSPEAKQAFDLSDEKPATRAAYGPRTIGQSCLLARRLVERGVPFVTVNNTGWDTHDDLVLRLKEGYAGAKVGVGLIPTFDLAFAALVGDLSERGLLDETLVIAMGEFGRTPKLNTPGGRDHWPRVFSVALAGGGIQGGQVIGVERPRRREPGGQPGHAGRPGRDDLHAARRRSGQGAAHLRRPAGRGQPGRTRHPGAVRMRTLAWLCLFVATSASPRTRPSPPWRSPRMASRFSSVRRPGFRSAPGPN